MSLCWMTRCFEGGLFLFVCSRHFNGSFWVLFSWLGIVFVFKGDVCHAAQSVIQCFIKHKSSFSHSELCTVLLFFMLNLSKRPHVINTVLTMSLGTVDGSHQGVRLLTPNWASDVEKKNSHCHFSSFHVQENFHSRPTRVPWHWWRWSKSSDPFIFIIYLHLSASFVSC